MSMKFELSLALLALAAGFPALGQPPSGGDEAAGAACAACGGSLLMIVGVVVGVIALNIAILVWVARDAKARGMDSAVLWMALVMFTGVIGLVIYLFARPQGQVTRCTHCGNSRLQASAKCPHCGHA